MVREGPDGGRRSAWEYPESWEYRLGSILCQTKSQMPGQKPKKPHPNEVLQAEFIAAYLDCHGRVGKACERVGVHRNTVLGWRKQPEFAAKLRAAKKEMEEELFECAVQRGLAKSDTLLMFALKALNGPRFDDNIRKAEWEAKRGITPVSAIPERLVLVREPLPEKKDEPSSH